jgi:hypothetical protein
VSGVSDDAVREVHGCRCREADNDRGKIIEAMEGEQYVTISVGHTGVRLTPWQARYLAAKLYRLSRRIRQRTGEA